MFKKQQKWKHVYHDDIRHERSSLLNTVIIKSPAWATSSSLSLTIAVWSDLDRLPDSQWRKEYWFAVLVAAAYTVCPRMTCTAGCTPPGDAHPLGMHTPWGCTPPGDAHPLGMHTLGDSMESWDSQITVCNAAFSLRVDLHIKSVVVPHWTSLMNSAKDFKLTTLCTKLLYHLHKTSIYKPNWLDQVERILNKMWDDGYMAVTRLRM